MKISCFYFYSFIFLALHSLYAEGDDFQGLNNKKIVALEGDDIAKVGNKGKLQAIYLELKALKENEDTDSKTKQKAHIVMMNIDYFLENDEKVVELGVAFLDGNKTSRYRPQIMSMLADAHERMGDNEEAISYSIRLLGGMNGRDDAGNEILRYMRLSEDKYHAYLVSYSFLRSARECHVPKGKSGTLDAERLKVLEKIKSEVAALEKLPAVQEGIKAAAEDQSGSAK